MLTKHTFTWRRWPMMIFIILLGGLCLGGFHCEHDDDDDDIEVSTPYRPQCVDEADVGDKVDISTGGSYASESGTIEYRIDFGNSEMSEWDEDGDFTYTYTAEGTYKLCAQARLKTVTSRWSDDSEIEIDDRAVIWRSICETSDGMIWLVGKHGRIASVNPNPSLTNLSQNSSLTDLPQNSSLTDLPQNPSLTDLPQNPSSVNSISWPENVASNLPASNIEIWKTSHSALSACNFYAITNNENVLIASGQNKTILETRGPAQSSSEAYPATYTHSEAYPATYTQVAVNANEQVTTSSTLEMADNEYLARIKTTSATKKTISPTINLYAIASCPNLTIVVGSQGAIWKQVGKDYQPMLCENSNTLRGVWLLDDSYGFAVGHHGTILHWNGIDWQEMASPTKARLNAIWGLNRQDVWAVGHQGTILHFDGIEWHIMPTQTTANLYSIHGNLQQNLWIAGDNFTLLCRKDSAWQFVKAPFAHVRGLLVHSHGRKISVIGEDYQELDIEN